MDKTQWTIGLLGSFRIERDGGLIERFEGRKEEMLLAFLALAPQRAHSRDEVTAALWPGKDRAAARRNLSYLLCVIRDRLRRLGLGDGIFVAARSLQLNPSVSTDVQEFKRVVLASAGTAGPVGQARVLSEALALYGDGLLPGIEAPWLGAERIELEALRDTAVRQLADSMQPAGVPYETLRHLSSSAWEGFRRLSAPPPGGVLSPRPASDPASAADPADFLSLAEAAEAHLGGPEHTLWLERIDDAYPAIKATLDASLRSGDRAGALPLATALWKYWYHSGRVDEGRWYLEQVLPAGALAPSIRNARALHAAGTLAHFGGDADQALQRLSAAMGLWRKLDDDQGLLRTLANLGMIACRAGDYARALSLYLDGVTVARRLGDDAALASRLSSAAVMELRLSHADEALALSAEQRAIAERLGDQIGVAFSLAHTASAEMMNGDHDAAASHAEAAARLFDAQRHAQGQALAMRLLGRLAHTRGDHRGALAWYHKSLRAASAAGDGWETAQTLRFMATTYAAMGRMGRAAALARQAVDLLHAAGDAAEARKAAELTEAIKAKRRDLVVSPLGENASI